MNRIFDFVKTTAIGGLLVIVPIAIILFVLIELFYGLYALAEEVTATLGIAVDDAIIMVGIALIALIGLCFVTGLVLQTRVGGALRNWLSRNIGRRIPMFHAIANITRRFAGIQGTRFAPVEIDLYDSGTRAIGFLVETLPHDRCTVFVPSAPVATVGNIYVVAKHKVTPIEASIADTITVITQWGVDAGDLYDKNLTTAPDGDSRI